MDSEATVLIKKLCFAFFYMLASAVLIIITKRYKIFNSNDSLLSKLMIFTLCSYLNLKTITQDCAVIIISLRLISRRCPDLSQDIN